MNIPDKYKRDPDRYKSIIKKESLEKKVETFAKKEIKAEEDYSRIEFGNSHIVELISVVIGLTVMLMVISTMFPVINITSSELCSLNQSNATNVISNFNNVLLPFGGNNNPCSKSSSITNSKYVYSNIIFTYKGTQYQIANSLKMTDGCADRVFANVSNEFYPLNKSDSYLAINEFEAQKNTSVKICDSLKPYQTTPVNSMSINIITST